MIGGSAQLRIRTCRADMLRLRRHRRNMSLARHCLLFRPRASIDAAVAAVVAHAVDRVAVPVNDRGVVNVVDVGHIDVVDRTVVEKPPVLPPAALVTLAEIPIAIVNAAIKTYLRRPVAFVEEEAAAAPRPVSRRPEQARTGCQYPCSRNPVVVGVVVVISPISRRPDVPLARA